MFAVARGRARRLACGTGYRRKCPRGRVIEAARVRRGAKDRIIGDEAAVLHRVEHRAIGRVNDAACIEGHRKVGVVTVRDRAFEQGVKRVAMHEAKAVVLRE